ncbi:hypothetical protein HDK64DRAFT_318856 [Phyllosticta capitalensis]
MPTVTFPTCFLSLPWCFALIFSLSFCWSRIFLLRLVLFWGSHLPKRPTHKLFQDWQASQVVPSLTASRLQQAQNPQPQQQGGPPVEILTEEEALYLGRQGDVHKRQRPADKAAQENAPAAQGGTQAQQLDQYAQFYAPAPSPAQDGGPVQQHVQYSAPYAPMYDGQQNQQQYPLPPQQYHPQQYTPIQTHLQPPPVGGQPAQQFDQYAQFYAPPPSASFQQPIQNNGGDLYPIPQELMQRRWHQHQQPPQHPQAPQHFQAQQYPQAQNNSPFQQQPQSEQSQMQPQPQPQQEQPQPEQNDSGSAWRDDKISRKRQRSSSSGNEIAPSGHDMKEEDGQIFEDFDNQNMGGLRNFDQLTFASGNEASDDHSFRSVTETDGQVLSYQAGPQWNQSFASHAPQVNADQEIDQDPAFAQGQDTLRDGKHQPAGVESNRKLHANSEIQKHLTEKFLEGLQSAVIRQVKQMEDKHKSQLKEFKLENDELKQAIAGLTEEFEIMKKDQGLVQDRLTKFSDEEGKSEHRYDIVTLDLEKVKERWENQRVKHNILNGRHFELQHQHDALKQSHEALKVERDTSKDKLKLLDQKHAVLQGQLDTLKQDLENSKAEHNTLKGNHNMLRQMHTGLSRQHNELRHDHEVLKADNNVTFRNLEWLKTSHEKLWAVQGRLEAEFREFRDRPRPHPAQPAAAPTVHNGGAVAKVPLPTVPQLTGAPAVSNAPNGGAVTNGPLPPAQSTGTPVVANAPNGGAVANDPLPPVPACCTISDLPDASGVPGGGTSANELDFSP